jgi:hypothetical protein
MNKHRMLSWTAEACRRLAVKAGSKAAGVLSLLALLIGGITSAHAATCVTGQWASINYGAWTVYLNGWGAGGGNNSPQICANWHGNWWATVQYSGGGIKAYPSTQTTSINLDLRQTRFWCGSNFDVSSPSAVNWNWTYDLWTANRADEIMILEFVHPGVGGGWGSKIASNVNIGGVAYDVWQANPGWNVIQFIRLQETHKGSADLWGIMKWCQNNGRLRNSNWRELHFGTEITATNGRQTFTCNNFWAGWGTW